MQSRIAFILVFAWVLVLNLHAASPGYEAARDQAEQLYAQGSFAKANELYDAISTNQLAADEIRWVAFRRADTQWRSQAATDSPDTTRLDEARTALERMVRDVDRDEDRDRIWAEVQESLGDFHWRRDRRDLGEALPYYQRALDWWAGARDIELARQRYLGIVWRMLQPPFVRGDVYSGHWGHQVPLELIRNALEIAQTPEDKARAHYFIALHLRNRGGDWSERARVPEEFEAALKAGKSTGWYDDALYNYGEYMLGQGRVIPLANGGGWQTEPDYPKALELFRRLVREFQKGETRYYDRAQQQIKTLTDPQVGVSVPNIFLPGSEIQYVLNWRNVKQIDLAIYPVNLVRDVTQPWSQQHESARWVSTLKLAGRESIRSWTWRTGDEGEHKPGNKALHLKDKLPPGAYVIEAKAEGQTARELILVSDATIVLKLSHRQALVFVCDALTGAPLTNASVKLLQHCMDAPPNYRDWYWRSASTNTDASGCAVFDVRPSPIDIQVFVAADADGRQAYDLANRYARDRLAGDGGKAEAWKLYAFTDRPAYRPGETVNWKFIARLYDGKTYSTPADQSVQFEITDPRGAKIKEDQVALNAFGSAWGTVELTPEMPLGEYGILFRKGKDTDEIGRATLFRLEEYKLPEFKVEVKVPEEAGGRKKTFRLGQTVEATVQAEYYFGGPVSDASVEVLVYQKPYWHWWQEPRPFPWFYSDMDNPHGPYGRWYGGGGQVIKRETLKTDAQGKVVVSFDTPANDGQDFEYRIEARVTDASRREIVGNGTVRVTRQAYYVNARPEHCLYRPQDKVTVDFKAMDANQQPVQAAGIVKVTRDFWFEIWIAPDGHEVKGDELGALRKESRIWPPPPSRPDQKGWRLKFRGYEHDEILTRSLRTGTNGEAQLTFTPEREGYYRVAWESDPGATHRNLSSPAPIRSETTVWVANNRTTELGYRHGGVEIIADKDTFQVGQTAPVMLVGNSPGRHVLFSVEGEELLSWQVVHLEGTVKLIQLPIEEQHVPNLFLNAAMVSDRELFLDSKQIVVPPVKNFLTLDVQPDRADYQPREQGTLMVTARDHEGKPVSAEIALSLVDESVFYIQGDYAGDPRQFFFGTKREHQVQTQGTMNWKPYARLVESQDGGLLDEKVQRERAGAAEEASASDAFAMNMPDASSMLSKGMMINDGGFGGGGALGGPRGSRRMDTLTPLPMRAMSGAMVVDREALSLDAAAAPAQAGAEPDPAVVVRSDFRSTVFWQPDVKTGRDGKATVKVTYPDSTTSWKATARAATTANQFGIVDATTRTKQPLIVRLQAPRFFVVGDQPTVSAVVNNNTQEDLNVRVTLDASGLVAAQGGKASTLSLKVPASGEARADWPTEVQFAGPVTLKVTARGGKFSDAMEMAFTAHEHGIEKFLSRSGKTLGDRTTLKLDLPKERKPGSTDLVVQVTPSMAVTMLDALPYLIDYPYGCTEQTMSRFLPAVITARTLQDLGLEPADIMGRVFGGIETNSAAATHPDGRRDLKELGQITGDSLNRLYDFQHEDGGWAWWKDGESDHWMSAYVVWGLTLARQAGIDVKPDVLQRGLDYLDQELVEEEAAPDMQAFMLHALATHYGHVQKGPGVAPTAWQRTAFDNLWNRRDQLNAYTRALLALSAHYFDYADRAKILIANLENGVQRDERPDQSVLIDSTGAGSANAAVVMGTAHWGRDGIFWRWSDGGVEATAFALKALLAIDPANALVEPVSNWLIKNRRGAQWSNTRDTAIVVLAMNDYLRQSGELRAEGAYELWVNGKQVARQRVTPKDVLRAPSRFPVEAGLVKDSNEIRIIRTGGTAPLYFAAEARFFSLEEPVTPAGNEIFVRRDYFKLVGRPTLLKGYVYDRQPLRDGDSVESGERVQTVLTIEGKNNYEYLVFEDLKPAGFESVEVRSGESLTARELKSGAIERRTKDRHPVYEPGPSDRSRSDLTGRERQVYQELRDRKVALFIDKLPEGIWEIRHDLRAEVPGRFHALPLLGHAMYVPEIRCNSDEIRVRVTDPDLDGQPSASRH